MIPKWLAVHDPYKSKHIANVIEHVLLILYVAAGTPEDRTATMSRFQPMGGPSR